MKIKTERHTFRYFTKSFYFIINFFKTAPKFSYSKLKSEEKSKNGHGRWRPRCHSPMPSVSLPRPHRLRPCRRRRCSASDTAPAIPPWGCAARLCEKRPARPRAAPPSASRPSPPRRRGIILPRASAARCGNRPKGWEEGDDGTAGEVGAGMRRSRPGRC